MALRSRFKGKDIRKWTTPIHVLFGLFLAGLPPAFLYISRITGASSAHLFICGVALSVVILGLFAWDEWWDDKSYGTNEGVTDWWEAFAAYVAGTVAFVVVMIVRGVLAGVGF